MESNMRRDFIRLTTVVGTGLLFTGCGRSSQTGPEQKSGSTKGEEEKVSRRRISCVSTACLTASF
jgi:hypothetical protein